MAEGQPLACLVCDVEWWGPPGEACFTCGGDPVPGRLRDYCPHGKRRPFRGWACRACRTSFIVVWAGRPPVTTLLDREATVNPG